ncbi:hypothetical protein AB0I28_17600 [Phytomonospora sp. NPDC050363]|uniref:hypothetical protein n=1 Tax=Phytomonospora sp. NPDC050363 TaxID=3155642 RepID=UPI0033DD5F3C
MTCFSADGPAFTSDSGAAKARVVFSLDDRFRLQVAPDGVFTDPANAPPGDPQAPAANIVVKTDYPAPSVFHAETDDAFRDTTIRITNPDGWEDGDVPNASPYYMSTVDYGVHGLTRGYADGGRRRGLRARRA